MALYENTIKRESSLDKPDKIQEAYENMLNGGGYQPILKVNVDNKLKQLKEVANLPMSEAEADRINSIVENARQDYLKN